MFYQNEFVGDHNDLYYGDITEAESHLQLKDLIKKLQNDLNTFHTYNAPDIIKQHCQERLIEVISYYRSMGGRLNESK